MMLSVLKYLPSAVEAGGVREHTTQPCRSGEKGQRQHPTGPTRGTGHGGMQPLNLDPIQGSRLWKLLAEMCHGHLVASCRDTNDKFSPKHALYWTSGITRRDVLITEILLWQCQGILTFISSQPAFAECSRAKEVRGETQSKNVNALF